MVTLSKSSNTYNEYMGLSTDDKPETAPENSLFLELDTNTFYYFADGQWVELGSAPTQDAPVVPPSESEPVA